LEWRFAFKQKLNLQQLYFICQQLSFALAGGMPLPLALRLVGGEMNRTKYRQFLLQLGEGVQRGQTMAQTLRQIEIGYSPVLLEFVLAGEQNGTMTETMTQAAAYFQQQHKIRQMLLSALIYPALILCLMLAAFVAMFFFVTPAIVQTYENFSTPLPVLTQMIIGGSHWLRDHWLSLILLFLGVIFFVILWLRVMLAQATGRRHVKQTLLHFPLLGRLYQQYWFIQLAQGLGLMLNSGMLLVNCLEAVQHIYRRSLFRDELIQLQFDLDGGQSFGDSLARCSFLPVMARQMLAVSEQTGTLSTAFLQLSQYYQRQFQQQVQTMIRLLEPSFLVGLGLMILLLASSLFLPLVQSYQYLL